MLGRALLAQGGATVALPVLRHAVEVHQTVRGRRRNNRGKRLPQPSIVVVAIHTFVVMVISFALPTADPPAA